MDRRAGWLREADRRRAGLTTLDDMTKRPYIGFDRVATAKRVGLESLIAAIADTTDGGLWNNGSLVVRSKRGKKGMSVHATGRAADLSWRPMGDRRRGSNYETAQRVADLLVDNADRLGLEAVFDYYPKPFGRGWKCDRGAWRKYTSRAFSGAPGGDWLHVEVSNTVADDPGLGDVWRAIWHDEPIPTAEEPARTRPYPGAPLRKGAQGDDVRWVQAIVDTWVDGDFGLKTEQAVRDFQHANPDAGPVDGWVGPMTWAELNRHA